jgi:hypothetical protein
VNSKTKAVFRGYTQLSTLERNELIQEIRKFNQDNYAERRRKEATIDLSEIRMELGPLSGGCPCCGR